MLVEQPFLIGGGIWIEVRDGNHTARSIFNRHYSRKFFADGRNQDRFCGPGEKMVLLTPCARALFVWRKQKFTLDGQTGVNCAIFRNEGAGRSSNLIVAAMALARTRWPGQRLYTYVDPRKIKSANPGFCFKSAGWKQCGITKVRKLVVLEYAA